MKFKYVGDKDRVVNDKKTVEAMPPSRTKMFGVDFELNGPAKEVPVQYEQKFLGNRCFELVNGNEPEPETVDEPEPELEPEPEPKLGPQPKKRGRPKKIS